MRDTVRRLQNSAPSLWFSRGRQPHFPSPHRTAATVRLFSATCRQPRPTAKVPAQTPLDRQGGRGSESGSHSPEGTGCGSSWACLPVGDPRIAAPIRGSGQRTPWQEPPFPLPSVLLDRASPHRGLLLRPGSLCREGTSMAPSGSPRRALHTSQGVAKP